jgi:steroid 5-alpha reductase family enzyme
LVRERVHCSGDDKGLKSTMNSALSVYTWNLAAVLAIMVCLWAYSLWKKDASIADVFWGLGFVIVAWITHARAEGFEARKYLLTLLTSLWGLRLAIHIGWRNWGKAEDHRYQTWRAKYGPRFWWVSLFTVFGIQGVLLWVISLVVQAGQLSGVPAHFTWLDGVGVLVWIAGITFEAVGDWQLARFKADSRNRGKVMNRGLWAYSRHPNYFGECLIWWGMFCITMATPGNLLTIISPLTITFLLLKVSGVTLLEKSIVERRPEYREYIESTSAFIPWLPKKGSGP